MDEEINALSKAARAEASRNQTAQAAVQILLRSGSGYILPTAKQKRLLLVEFATRNLVVYGKAFDVVRVDGSVELDNPADIAANFEKITLCEIKSSGRKLPEDFKGYFFALTAAELLVAQSLKHRFRFILVSTATGRYEELTLQELFARSRGIYPTWSIMF